MQLDFLFSYLKRAWLGISFGALVISAMGPKAEARIEYASDMRTVAELPAPAEEASLASEVRAKMLDVSQISDERGGPDLDSPQVTDEPVNDEGPDAPEKTQERSALKDAALTPEANGEPARSADPNLSDGMTTPQPVFTLALDEVSGESVGLFFTDSRLERRISFKKELEGRQAHGFISREESAEIEAELLRNAGVHYRVPHDEQELKAALGFAPDTPVSREDLRDLMTVHVQFALGFQPETSAYLARVVWILTSGRVWAGQ